MQTLWPGLTLLGAVMFSCFAAAQDANPPSAKAPQLCFQDMQGAWSATKGIQDGQDVNKPNWYWNFTGVHTLVVQKNNAGDTSYCVLELDFTKDPVQFAFQPPGLKKSGVMFRGIIKKRGPKLIVALSHPEASKGPPVDFKSEKGSRVIYMEFSRPKIAKPPQPQGG